MKFKLTALVSALVLAFSAAGCAKKGDPGKIPYGDSAAFSDTYGKVKNYSEGPVLSISNTKAKAGETAEVTVSVKDADKKWMMCGIHVVYPDFLTAVLEDEADRSLRLTEGDAAKGSIGFIGKLWRDNLPEELTKTHKGAVFFTTMFNGDKGGDGDIITIYFNVPENAQPGTVYNIEFYYSNTQAAQDMFRGDKADLSFEKYAFTHWQNGTVTVE